uniref:Reverse transcriptase zinc-binding domain-containing protein n=1 Tax=Aegilops tauschii subsp. strangulata TaxID=200361 RepID=A0A453DAW8_AEGTS
MRGRSVQINSGDVAQVWEDSLNGMPPMRVQYPQLFSICNMPKITVDKLGGVEAGDMFRRRLNPPLDNMWNEMCTTVLNTISSTEPDQVGWAPGPKRRFTTKSMYKLLESNLAGCDYRWIWKAKIPLKIRIFMWQLFQDAVLTRDVMKRRKWPGNANCSFCAARETAQHLFFLCPVARVIWRSVGVVLGTDLCPNNLWQYYTWCYIYLPDGAKFYTFGLAAICWAV